MALLPAIVITKISLLLSQKTLHGVRISQRYFPANITVPVEATVTWINTDNFQHTITSGVQINNNNGINDIPDGKFTSGLLGPGSSYSYTFRDRIVEYQYYCTPQTLCYLIIMLLLNVKGSSSLNPERQYA
jgi:plastocyanin